MLSPVFNIFFSLSHSFLIHVQRVAGQIYQCNGGGRQKSHHATRLSQHSSHVVDADEAGEKGSQNTHVSNMYMYLHREYIWLATLIPDGSFYKLIKNSPIIMCPIAFAMPKTCTQPVLMMAKRNGSQ